MSGGGVVLTTSNINITTRIVSKSQDFDGNNTTYQMTITVDDLNENEWISGFYADCRPLEGSYENDRLHRVSGISTTNNSVTFTTSRNADNSGKYTFRIYGWVVVSKIDIK